MGTKTELVSNGYAGKDELDTSSKYNGNLKLLPCNDQVKELQTILRDKYVYYSILKMSTIFN